MEFLSNETRKDSRKAALGSWPLALGPLLLWAPCVETLWVVLVLTFNFGNFGNRGPRRALRAAKWELRRFWQFFLACTLRFDLDLRPYRPGVPDFFNLRIGDGDATVSPVSLAVQGTEVCELRHEAVNHDVASGRDAKFVRALPVGRVGIGNPQREMKFTVRILGADCVIAFGR